MYLHSTRTSDKKNIFFFIQIKLVLVGSCRGEEDEQLLKNIQDLSKHLSLEESVEFKVNVTHQELIQCYQMASIGLHTMWNEHFGIGIVESMAAGLIMVANKSGGPLLDIIETSKGSQTGYLATDALEYAECLANILYSSKQENEAIRIAARWAFFNFILNRLIIIIFISGRRANGSPRNNLSMISYVLSNY